MSNSLIYILTENNPVTGLKEIMGVTQSETRAINFFEDTTHVRDILPFRIDADYFGPAEDKEAMDLIAEIKGE